LTDEAEKKSKVVRSYFGGQKELVVLGRKDADVEKWERNVENKQPASSHLLRSNSMATILEND